MFHFYHRTVTDTVTPLARTSPITHALRALKDNVLGQRAWHTGEKTDRVQLQFIINAQIDRKNNTASLLRKYVWKIRIFLE
jgi:hypothetical protein